MSQEENIFESLTTFLMEANELIYLTTNLSQETFDLLNEFKLPDNETPNQYNDENIKKEYPFNSEEFNYIYDIAHYIAAKYDFLDLDNEELDELSSSFWCVKNIVDNEFIKPIITKKSSVTLPEFINEQSAKSNLIINELGKINKRLNMLCPE